LILFRYGSIIASDPDVNNGMIYCAYFLDLFNFNVEVDLFPEGSLLRMKRVLLTKGLIYIQ
jgi:hypothetical protein